MARGDERRRPVGSDSGDEIAAAADAVELAQPAGDAEAGLEHVSAGTVGTQPAACGVADALVWTIAEQSGIAGPHASFGIGGTVVLDDAEECGIGGFAVQRFFEDETAPPFTVQTRVVRGGAGADFVDRSLRPAE